MTEEQKLAIKKLRWAYLKGQLNSSLWLLFCVVAACVVITVVDGLFVNSDAFRHVASGLTGLYLGLSFAKQDRKKYEIFIEEYKKILK